jgi:hypothetical protein
MKAIHDTGAALFDRHPPRFSTGLYNKVCAVRIEKVHGEKQSTINEEKVWGVDDVSGEASEIA